MNNTKVDETLIGYGEKKVWSYLYTGGKNPHRKGTYNYDLWNTDRDWWMNNLNINIIRDYLQNLNYQISALETQNDMLWDFKNNVEDKQYQ